jgi:hypothetical protein
MFKTNNVKTLVKQKQYVAADSLTFRQSSKVALKFRDRAWQLFATE